jgi:hypothetical protein
MQRTGAAGVVPVIPMLPDAAPAADRHYVRPLTMPNRDFFALGEDHRQVLDHVFTEGACRVFELYSPFDTELAEFKSVADIEARCKIDDWSVPDREILLLQLHPHDAAGKLVIERIELNPRKCKGATFRYSCNGWGLVQLYLESVRRGALHPSHTNHNSPKRAAAWSSTYPDLGSPEAWNWNEVIAFSRRLNRHIDKLAVAKIDSQRVLPRAAKFLVTQPTGPNHPTMNPAPRQAQSPRAGDFLRRSFPS